MNGRERRDDWAVVASIAIIAVGVWFLFGNIFGDWWQQAVRQAFRIIWPVALIVLGVLLYLTATRGGWQWGSSSRRLYRSRGDRMVSGVLGGIASHLGIDSTLARVLYVIFGLLTGFWPALVLYVVATVIIPEEPVGAGVEPPSWPTAGGPQQPTGPSGGWPHTGSETVQPPPPPPAAPGQETPPSAEGPAQS